MEIDSVQTIYLMHCSRYNVNTYYSKGINVCNVPFHTFDYIEFQKITVYGRRQFIYNLFPAFLRFQRMIKKWLRRRKSPRRILER